MHNVDIISNVNLGEMSQQFLESKDDAWLLTQDRETNRKLLFDDENRLVGWMNKAEQKFKWVHNESALRQAQGPSLKEMAFSGLHFFRSDLFANFECKPQSVIDLYLNLAKNNRIVSKPIQPDYWFDLGKPEQLIAAENYLKTNRHFEDYEGTDTLAFKARYDMPPNSE